MVSTSHKERLLTVLATIVQYRGGHFSGSRDCICYCTGLKKRIENEHLVISHRSATTECGKVIVTVSAIEQFFIQYSSVFTPTTIVVNRDSFTLSIQVVCEAAETVTKTDHLVGGRHEYFVFALSPVGPPVFLDYPGTRKRTINVRFGVLRQE